MKAGSSKMGRPKTFDRENALEIAMRLFWRHGYDGTSISDLTSALGVSPPTLYGAFGSKEGLFREALRAYADGPRRRSIDAFLGAPTAGEAVAGFLRRSAEELAAPDRPRGCMIASGGLQSAEASRVVAEECARNRAELTEVFRRRFIQALEGGELPPTASPGALAHFYGAVLQGMSTQAVDGASAALLREIAEMAIATWPDRAANPPLPGTQK